MDLKKQKPDTTYKGLFKPGDIVWENVDGLGPNKCRVVDGFDTGLVWESEIRHVNPITYLKRRHGL
jgi:hypothetical protein